MKKKSSIQLPHPNASTSGIAILSGCVVVGLLAFFAGAHAQVTTPISAATFLSRARLPAWTQCRSPAPREGPRARPSSPYWKPLLRARVRKASGAEYAGESQRNGATGKKDALRTLRRGNFTARRLLNDRVSMVAERISPRSWRLRRCCSILQPLDNPCTKRIVRTEYG